MQEHLTRGVGILLLHYRKAGNPCLFFTSICRFLVWFAYASNAMFIVTAETDVIRESASVNRFHFLIGYSLWFPVSCAIRFRILLMEKSTACFMVSWLIDWMTDWLTDDWLIICVCWCFVVRCNVARVQSCDVEPSLRVIHQGKLSTGV